MKLIYANITLLSFSVAACFTGTAQETDSIRHSYPDSYKRYLKTEIVTGYNFQTSEYNGSKPTRQYFELGIARSIHQQLRHGPVSMGLLLSEEVYLGNRNIYGTKLGMYTHYLFDVGFSVIYYTDFRKGNLKLRPELGLGLGFIRIAGGFNIPTFENGAFPELARSNAQLVIQLLLPIHRKEIGRGKNMFKELSKFNYGIR